MATATPIETDVLKKIPGCTHLPIAKRSGSGNSRQKGDGRELYRSNVEGFRLMREWIARNKIGSSDVTTMYTSTMLIITCHIVIVCRTGTLCRVTLCNGTRFATIVVVVVFLESMVGPNIIMPHINFFT